MSEAPIDSAVPPYLTTKEVASLLRVKERKVYDLAAAGEIPHRRITGKLLFPRAEITAWIEGGATRPMMSEPVRPDVLAGSHDPLLDWAVRESDCGLASLLNGSLDGLQRFVDGSAALCGLHVPDGAGWNIETVEARAPGASVLIAWARRSRGVMLAQDCRDQVAALGDLRGRRVALRQPGAGTTTLFERLLAAEGMSEADLTPAASLARTESDAAAAVAEGEADAALGLEAMARRFHLGFLPLVEERFDLLIDRRAYFTEPVQILLSFARTEALERKAAALGGYDLTELGTVRWLSP